MHHLRYVGAGETLRSTLRGYVTIIFREIELHRPGRKLQGDEL